MKKTYHNFLLTLIILTALLTGCAGKTSTNTAEQKEETKNSSVQETAESLPQEEESKTPQIDFEGQDMDGNTVSSSIFSESKLTMVNVWATYCNPCLSEMPELGELAGEYDAEEFQIIGIISDVFEEGNEEMMNQANALIEQTGANYTHLLINQSIYDALLTDVAAVPTTFFIDENGTVLDTVIGARDKSAWEEKINELLEGH